MNIVISFSSLCMLLIIGKAIRTYFKFFQKIYIPASVIAGIIGLIIIQILGKYIPNACILGWDKLPSFLINIVFAALFLGVAIPSLSTVWKNCGPQLAYGQIVAWGQYTVGIAITLLILLPLFSIPSFFGVIVPVGFEGGHGTAAGLKQTFDLLNWPQGTDFSLAAATVGIISAIIVGMILINWAARKGITQKLKPSEANAKEQSGIYKADKRPIAGYQTVEAGSVDSLALHIAIIGAAILIGILLKKSLISLGLVFPILLEKMILQSFPLFPLCMIGGLIIQLVLSKGIKIDVVDHHIMQRISGTALDFLVVSAIALINIKTIFSGFLPFFIIVLGAILWNVFCVLWLAPRILPDAWFERAIAEMGQSMGVTATGMLLLRVVDPEAETKATSAFGYKQLLHEPFMGGGVWTSIAVPLCITQGPVVILIISIIAIAAWLLVWRFLFRGGTVKS